MKLSVKLFIANTLAVLALVALLTYIVMQQGSKIIRSEIEDSNRLSVQQTAQNIDNLLDYYEQTTDSLYVNQLLQNQLEVRFEHFRDTQNMYNEYILPVFRVLAANKDLVAITLYTDNPTLQFADVRLLDDSIRAEAWYRELKERRGKRWSGLTTTPYNNLPIISLYQRLNNQNPNAEIYVKLDVNVQVLRKLVDKESKARQYVIAFPDGGVAMDSSLPNAKGRRLEQYGFYPAYLSSKGNSFTYRDNGKAYLCAFQTLNSRNSVDGIQVIVLTPMEKVTQKLGQIRTLSLRLFILFGIVLGFIIFLIARLVTNRLVRFTKTIREIDRPDTRHVLEVSGRDEVSQLGHVFNVMMQRLNLLVNDVYQYEMRQKELALRTTQAELAALQAQINPHYLFNTLNMIRANLLNAGDRGNARLVELLARSFRNMLRHSEPRVTLSEELEMVDIYLQIQACRFSDKLRYSIDIEPSLRHYQIPKLIIQPLVENAMVHAVELMERQAYIHISARIDSERLIVWVEDNGPGIAADRLEEIRMHLQADTASKDGRHVGLQNVHQRLKRELGEESGVAIDSVPGEGTRVLLTLPL